MRKLTTMEMNRLSPQEFISSKKTPISLVLDNIRSMHNVGAAFRIADAFLVEKVILCGITATPPRNEISKTALGAEDHVDWSYFNKTIDALNELQLVGCKLVAIEQVCGSTFLENFTPKGVDRYAIVFGNEVSGIDDEVINMCDYCLEIKQLGVKHSLNVSVSMGIVAWHFMKNL